MNVKQSGTWQIPTDIQAKVAGVWTDVQQVNVKTSGVWREDWFRTPQVALRLDGTDDYVLTGTDAVIDFSGTNPLTIEGWFNVDALPETGSYKALTFVDGTADVDLNDKSIEINSSGTVAFYVFDGAQKRATSTTTISAGGWYHITCTYDGANIRVYLDGALEGITAASGTYNATTPKIQLASTSGSVPRYNGKQSDIRVWSTVRTQTEIQDNMNKRLAGTETGLVAYYRLDEGTGTTAEDSAGTNDGTIVGATWV